MAKIKGICRNEECDMCDQIQEAEKSNFKCEECGKDLIPFGNKSGGGGAPTNKKKLIAAIVGGLVLTGLIVVCFFLFRNCGGKTGGGDDGTDTTDTVIPRKDTIKVKQLSINGGDFTLKLGDSKQLKTTAVPEQHDETLTWSSDNEAVATVDNTGKVIAKKKGEANIKITADTSGVSASVKVTVEKKGDDETGVDLGYAKVKVTNGKWPKVQGRMIFKSSHVIDSRDPKGRVAEPGDYVIGEWVNGHLVQGKWYGADNQVKGSILIGQ